jgi:hypothetical protein
LAVQEYTAYAPDQTINENRKLRNLKPLDLVGIMTEINDIRAAAGLEVIDQPLDDVMLDLMLRVPVRLIPMLSSNTSTLSGKTGLRVGQIDAAGEEVPDPMQYLLTDSQYDDGSGEEVGGSPSAREDATNQNSMNTGANQMPKVGTQADTPGTMTGAHFVQANAGRSWNLAAMRVGQRAELNRWRKVALKEAGKGKDPAEYVFETQALPDSVINVVRSQLVGADSVKIDILFETVAATLVEVVA